MNSWAEGRRTLVSKGCESFLNNVSFGLRVPHELQYPTSPLQLFFTFGIIENKNSAIGVWPV